MLYSYSPTEMKDVGTVLLLQYVYTVRNGVMVKTLIYRIAEKPHCEYICCNVWGTMTAA